MNTVDTSKYDNSKGGFLSVDKDEIQDLTNNELIELIRKNCQDLCDLFSANDYSKKLDKLNIEIENHKQDLERIRKELRPNDVKIEQIIKNNDLEALKEWLKNNNRNTALTIASENGALEIAEFLLKHGADDINNSLFIATKYGHIEIVKLLLNYSPKIYDLLNKDPLITASQNGYSKIVQLLLDYGFDNIERSFESAVINNHKDVEKVLLNKIDKETAFSLAETALISEAFDEIATLKDNLFYDDDDFRSAMNMLLETQEKINLYKKELL